MVENWKRALFAVRPHACTCRDAIPGVCPDRTDPACPVHGWQGDADAESGRSIVENDAIQGELNG